jgi:hypothetical protein
VFSFHDVANRDIDPHHQFVVTTQQRVVDKTEIIECAIGQAVILNRIPADPALQRGGAKVVLLP